MYYLHSKETWVSAALGHNSGERALTVFVCFVVLISGDAARSGSATLWQAAHKGMTDDHPFHCAIGFSRLTPPGV
jgi:hypothetical protein